MTEKISFIEIDLNRCSERYGVAPCTATLSVDQPDKCFNCFATCQDKANYNKEIVTARHSTASRELPLGIDAISDIKSVSITAAKLDLGESMGTRASIQIQFGDARYPDTGPEGDYYLADRDYDPYTIGTYWGKFRARYPFMKGEAIRLIRGDNNQPLEQMETRNFIIDSMAGPNSNGSFNIVCKDALKLTDKKKAQAPVLSQGELNADINASVTSVTLSPAGIGNAEYPASGFINLSGDEICSFTRSSDVLTISRGQFNTEAVEHEAGARVQLCLQYVTQEVTSIIKDLLVNYSGVPSSYINMSDWTLEDQTFINRVYSALIPEPEAANDLINELLQQTASTIWWDDIGKQIRFRVLKEVSTGAGTYNDDVILADSFSAKDQESKRVSQVWTYFGQINPLEDLKDSKNYSRTQVNVSLESEVNYEGVPSIKRIYSRWIGGASRPTASRLNDLILQRYSTAPRLVSFNLQRDTGAILPVLGSGYNVNSWTLQSATGQNQNLPIQLVQVKSSETGYAVIGEEVTYSGSIVPEDPTTKTIIIEENLFNLNLYEYAISGNTTNPPPQTGDTYIFSLNSEFVIGSESTSMPALDTGNEWPTGVTLQFINNGVIAGKGGTGGRGGSVNLFNVSGTQNISFGNDFFGQQATDGGPAFAANHAIEIIVESGGVVGGGGGGGGGASGSSSGGPQSVGDLFGGSAGGAGGGSTASGGGSGGPASSTSSNFYNAKSDGNSGLVGSLLAGGDGGASQFSGAALAGKGGKGGGLGENGDTGQTSVIPNYNNSGAGATGGLAGSAINKNGFTVTITNNGQILGAINT